MPRKVILGNGLPSGDGINRVLPTSGAGMENGSLTASPAFLIFEPTASVGDAEAESALATGSATGLDDGVFAVTASSANARGAKSTEAIT
ncbi:MAG TPA: hypothetical protein DCM28_15040 [Phycisphaerales bacterium]|nr:hypothetical protein [Phycisphaerales bacterium]